ncbi:ABC transporter permease subunit [Chelativorans sp. Marseille-P2723]|uniref:ABC transporter permease n=1 Tax=Chelativorans sp. Marseille-P2723 TaxID=2709133 RepID=UPI00156DF4C8|nr:ABC transporter permease subunit [Chelativorans sp. Marseille-P2723]
MIRRHYQPAGLFTRSSSLLASSLGMIAIVLLYLPIAGLALLSFSAQPLRGIPWPFTFEWYGALVAGETASKWISPLLTSISIGILVSIASTATALLIGRAVPTLRRSTGLLVAYLCVIVLPGILVGVAVLLFYRVLLGLTTGFWSVFLVHFIWALPFSLLCILIVTLRFDRRLLDAAEDLGASKFRQFIDIELPLLMPGVMASLFFSFLLSFNELPRTLYARGSVVTLPYYVWTASSSHSSQVSLIYALSSIIMVLSFLVTLVAMRILNKRE